MKSVFWAINASFYFDFAFIASSNGRRSSISFGYCVIINNRGCVLDASSNSTCSFAHEGVLWFFDDHRASPFVRILCMCRAWQAMRVGSGDSLAELLDWTGISVTGSRSAGNIMTSAGPDDNFGRQFWRQLSLMKIKWTIIFKNGTCIGDSFQK